ncbi:MAG: hypothetical protein OEV37_02465 [Candidatus Berkelbacteria bacterium]|nr:hypothetical protein [Candidatus Berkelbacteria bacterium]
MLSIYRYTASGVEKTDISIPWTQAESQDGVALQCWDAEWLEGMMHNLVDEAGEEGLLGLAAPGADLYVEGCPILHYRTLMKRIPDLVARATEIVPAEHLYVDLGGAAVQPFNALYQCVAYRDLLGCNPAEDGRTVCTLVDRLTEWACRTGEVRAELQMAQSQGLLQPCQEEVYQALGLAAFYGRLSDSNFFGADDLVRAPNGAWVMPATHDSVWARLIGYLMAPWVLWTGGWIGWARLIGEDEQVLPVSSFLGAGIAFEGVGNGVASVVGNVGMHGAVYSALRAHLGWSFDQMSPAAQRHLPWDGERLDVEAVKPEEGALHAFVSGLVSKLGRERACAAVVASSALDCAEALQRASSALEVACPSELAVVGGWYHNRAFGEALGDCGFKVDYPAFGGSATEDGVAAEALRRWSIQEGASGLTFKQAHQAIAEMRG